MEKSWYIGKSRVHGLGVIAARDIDINETVGEASTIVTPSKVEMNQEFGVWLNHKSSPIDNVVLRRVGNKLMAVSIKQIPSGAEIVIDYNKLPPFFQGSKKNFK